MKILQPTESGTKEAAALSGDYSLVEPKTTSKSLQMRILDPVHDPSWDHVVALHRDADCFHTSAWAKVLHQTYNHQPFYLQFSRGRRLTALTPLMEVRSPFTGRRGVCLPFSDACEPLIFDPEAVGLVRDQLVRFAQERRWKHLEIRGGKSFQLAPSAATKFYGHTLDLRSGAEELTTRFASPVRRAIRKAERSDVSAAVVRNRPAISDFYRLHVQTRRRHGLPPQPASFFLNIYEHIIRPGLGFIVLARRGSRPIAAAIFFRFGKNALYKYGASDKRFQEFRANNLVMWRGIQFLARNAAEKLHFGRTACENDGLRRFKLSWGTEEETIDYFRIDSSGGQCLIAAPHHSGFHKRIFGRLPLAFNRLAGSMIYPHLD
ncbi:MAG: GNAT family N-acetyltransferase [Verrucomicrobia bacterium]|nr:MAG: GNAT family N-acetyltransferase [Verrucomicrobiota bacterium]